MNGVSLAENPGVIRRVLDARGRPLRDLRVSVTDVCNMRCDYCMPEAEYTWLDRDSVLTSSEMATLVEGFVAAGVDKVRFTGGEPLLRRDLTELVAAVAPIAGITDLALTTNGSLLASRADALRRAGLRRITVSLDTLQPERHLCLTRRDNHRDVLAGVSAAAAAGFEVLKINTVVIRGVNDGELIELLKFAASVGAELRFIEYMDVGGATRWSAEDVVSAEEILAQAEARLGPLEAVAARGSAPAQRYRTAAGQTFGVVASTTTPFCASCDRSRLTADGQWFRCLYSADGTDLRSLLRGGMTSSDMTELIVAEWCNRRDQGAVDRVALSQRTATPVQILRADPHREMHTRGG